MEIADHIILYQLEVERTQTDFLRLYMHKCIVLETDLYWKGPWHN